MNKEEARERHTKLTGQGWLRRFTAEEPRLSEMKEFYESLGLEVLVECFAAEDQECRVCLDEEEFGDRYKTLYTRGEESGEEKETDDFFD